MFLLILESLVAFFVEKPSAKNDAKLAPYQNLYNKNFVTKYVSIKEKEGKQNIFDIEPKKCIYELHNHLYKGSVP